MTTLESPGRRSQDPGDLTEVALAENAFRTAISRTRPSLPARTLIGYIKDLCKRVPGKAVVDVLDFGCGRGIDVLHFRREGLVSSGYDIHKEFGWGRLPQTQTAKVVTSTYVLNVIPSRQRRLHAVREMASLAKVGGFVVLTVREQQTIAREARKHQWRPFGDGYISNENRSTFQKGFSQKELLDLGIAAGLRPIKTQRSFNKVGAVVAIFQVMPERDER